MTIKEISNMIDAVLVRKTIQKYNNRDFKLDMYLYTAQKCIGFVQTYCF